MVEDSFRLDFFGREREEVLIKRQGEEKEWDRETESDRERKRETRRGKRMG